MSAIEWSIESLRAFPETLRAFIATVPRETLDWAPKSWDGIPSEELTIRQQLCHLRDIEAEGYIVRFKRVLAEQNPTLASIDPASSGKKVPKHSPSALHANGAHEMQALPASPQAAPSLPAWHTSASSQQPLQGAPSWPPSAH